MAAAQSNVRFQFKDHQGNYWNTVSNEVILTPVSLDSSSNVFYTAYALQQWTDGTGGTLVSIWSNSPTTYVIKQIAP